MSLLLICFSLLLILASRSQAVTNDAIPCTDFFKPACSCSTDANGKNIVTCQYVSPTDIYEAFHDPNVNATDIYGFTYLVRDLTELNLPADLLGEHRITGLLSITWWTSNKEIPLIIDTDAFSSSAESLRSLSIQGFNARLLDWEFLNRLENLTNLAIYDMSKMESFSSYRSLTSPLGTITVSGCSGLTGFPEMPPNITRVNVGTNGLDDKAASTILHRLFVVNDTLTDLDMSNQPLTVIPEELKAFTALKFINLKWTNITYLPTASFVSPFYFQSLNLEQSNVTYVESNAFQGYYGGALVNMRRNLVNRFEEPAFRNMLVDMYCQRSGQLDFEYSNVTCDCSIAWLVRDSRHLLPYVWRGTCSNSTYFNKLSAAGFAHCMPTENVTVCQEVPTTTARPTTTTVTSTSSTSTITMSTTTIITSAGQTTSSTVDVITQTDSSTADSSTKGTSVKTDSTLASTTSIPLGKTTTSASSNVSATLMSLQCALVLSLTNSFLKIKDSGFYF